MASVSLVLGRVRVNTVSCLTPPPVTWGQGFSKYYSDFRISNPFCLISLLYLLYLLNETMNYQTNIIDNINLYLNTDKLI